MKRPQIIVQSIFDDGRVLGINISDHDIALGTVFTLLLRGTDQTPDAKIIPVNFKLESVEKFGALDRLPRGYSAALKFAGSEAASAAIADLLNGPRDRFLYLGTD